MKKTALLLLTLLFALSLMGCKDRYKVSYLKATQLNYPLNSLTIVQGLTEADIYEPEGVNPNPGGPGGGFPGFPGGPGIPGGTPAKKESKYKARIINKAPWVSAPFWGASVEGSRPLTLTIESVKTKGEKADAAKLIKNVSIYGEGIFSVPFENDIPLGEYLISLRVANISGSTVVNDCFTIIVTDKKW